MRERGGRGEEGYEPSKWEWRWSSIDLAIQASKIGWDPAMVGVGGGPAWKNREQGNRAAARLGSPGTAAVFTGKDAKAGRDSTNLLAAAQPLI